MRNSAKGRSIAKFGRRYRRLIDRRIRKALGKFVHWRSLEDTVEGRPLEGSGGNVRWRGLVGTVEVRLVLLKVDGWRGKTAETVGHCRNPTAGACPL